MGAATYQKLFFVFQSGTEPVYAISRDVTGANIRHFQDRPGWFLRGEIGRSALQPEVQETLRARGFCILASDELEQVRDGS